MKKNVIILFLIALLFPFVAHPLHAEEVEAGWDEEDKTDYLTRKVSTSIAVYKKTNGTLDATIEEGIVDGVSYAILRVNPNNDTIVQVDYQEEPQYLSGLKDTSRLSEGYSFVGSINGGYFSNGDYEYGKPVGAVRRNNQWTRWYGSENTPAYGSGFATAYLNHNDLSLKYHGWNWGFWHGDDSWKWWRGYKLDAEYGVSGSFTYFKDGQQVDITNGDVGGVNYHTYGRAVTILAQKKNKQFLLINIYGTLSEERITAFLKELNAYQAIRLDGGLSTQMLYEDTLVKKVDPELAYTKLPDDVAANTTPKIGEVTVKVDGLAIRMDASKDAHKLGTAKNGKTYAVYDSKVNQGYTWYQIGTSRWIASKPSWISYQKLETKPEVKEEVKQEEPVAKEENTPKDTVTVKVDGLTIREGSSVSSKRLGNAENGKTYTIYETAKDAYYTWYRIGENQWIAGKPEWVSVNQETKETANSNLGKVTVKVDLLIIRNQASIYGQNLGYAENGKTYPVYETKVNQGYTWYRIEEGKWIAGNQNWVTYEK
ncbi:MAG: phosphodiester glycosidase family protein [Solobacterium sp.]|nr:phosphodiester glycosidase family protein [Solobacterium sp.]